MCIEKAASVFVNCSRNKSSINVLLDFIRKTSTRKNITPKEVSPSFTPFRPFSIQIAIAIQALYCKRGQQRKGNKKSRTSNYLNIHTQNRTLQGRPEAGRQTNKEAVTPWAVSYRQSHTNTPESQDSSNQEEIGRNGLLSFTTLSVFAVHLAISI